MQVPRELLWACSALLGVKASLAQPRLWPVYLLAAIMAALNGIHGPSLGSLTPRLVDREDLPAKGPAEAPRSKSDG